MYHVYSINDRCCSYSFSSWVFPIIWGRRNVFGFLSSACPLRLPHLTVHFPYLFYKSLLTCQSPPPPSLCWYWCICHSPQHMSFFPSLDMSIFFVTCATLLILSHVRISLYLQFPFLAFLLPTYLRHTPMSPLQNWENRDNLAWQLFSGMKR